MYKVINILQKAGAPPDKNAIGEEYFNTLASYFEILLKASNTEEYGNSPLGSGVILCILTLILSKGR